MTDNIIKLTDYPVMMIVSKPDDCPYMTVVECILSEAKQQEEKAIEYLKAGNLHHAIGCYKKMVKKLEKAYLFTHLEKWK